jgi:DNA modification methylase
MAVREQWLTEAYALYNGDSCEVMAELPDGSVDLSIYSPPFCGLFHYSSSERDLSNCRTYDEFFAHYQHTVTAIERLSKPGRMTAVHCMDVPSGNTGTDHLIDFPGDIIRLHTQCREPRCTAEPLKRANGECRHGWFELVARYHVWKEPLGVRNRTMAKNLAHKTIVQDSSRCANAAADQVVVFRKRGKNRVPIAHPTGLLEYAGARQIPAELLPYRGWTGNQIENRYSHWIWRQYASAFWDDVRIDNVVPYEAARDADDERHIHPLQLDVIERLLVLFSNPGETVLTPFAGVGSEVYQAVLSGRRGIGIELKPSYYRQAVRNCASAEKRRAGLVGTGELPFVRAGAPAEAATA